MNKVLSLCIFTTVATSYCMNYDNDELNSNPTVCQLAIAEMHAYQLERQITSTEKVLIDTQNRLAALKSELAAKNLEIVILSRHKRDLERSLARRVMKKPVTSHETKN